MRFQAAAEQPLDLKDVFFKPSCRLQTTISEKLEKEKQRQEAQNGACQIPQDDDKDAHVYV